MDKRNAASRIGKYFWSTVASPETTFNQILHEKSIAVLAPVLIFGILAAITYLVSYLYGASITLEEQYSGRFGVEPILPIPKETYRLWESLFILPIILLPNAVSTARKYKILRGL